MEINGNIRFTTNPADQRNTRKEWIPPIIIIDNIDNHNQFSKPIYDILGNNNYKIK